MNDPDFEVRLPGRSPDRDIEFVSQGGIQQFVTPPPVPDHVEIGDQYVDEHGWAWLAVNSTFEGGKAPASGRGYSIMHISQEFCDRLDL